ncbi:hypothetical protein VNO80_17041 [Phaseolus coccineus]|uniref:Uncharacterized protein n=1 Tax=Phaseolus coccineus TaxID=3886 RepID=A0AAN9MN32_PHACN
MCLPLQSRPLDHIFQVKSGPPDHLFQVKSGPPDHTSSKSSSDHQITPSKTSSDHQITPSKTSSNHQITPSKSSPDYQITPFKPYTIPPDLTFQAMYYTTRSHLSSHVSPVCKQENDKGIYAGTGKFVMWLHALCDINIKQEKGKKESFGVCLSYLNSHHLSLASSFQRLGFSLLRCQKLLPFFLFCSFIHLFCYTTPFFTQQLKNVELLRLSKEDGLIVHFYTSWCLDRFKCSRSHPLRCSSSQCYWTIFFFFLDCEVND